MRRTLPTPLFLGAAFAAGALLACTALTSPPTPEPIASDTPVTSAVVRAAGSVTGSAHPMPSDTTAIAPPINLKVEDIKVGTGPEAKMGDTVQVQYVGTFPNGKKFDASGDKPFSFTIGGRFIAGWNRGVPGMKVGGERKLTIPYTLGYGERGAPPRIPPRATLVFDIKLVSIQSK